jgi:iron complex transport system permease protein
LTKLNTYKYHKQVIFLLFPTLLIIVFFINISYGTVAIPFAELLKSLLGEKTTKSSWAVIIWQFRLPKAITAVLVGTALSVSGLQMQTLFRNPLADAYTFGISSGASLGVALFILAGVNFFPNLNHWSMVVAAFIGSSVVMLLIFLIASNIRNMVSLLIIGIMLGNGIGAIIIILQSFSGKEELQRYINWGYGTLGAVDWQKMQVFLPLVFLGVIFSLFLHKPLNTMLLSENYAQSMGLDLKKNRLILILINSILVGSVTAFCGIIGFIGIAVPHICRQIFRTSLHQILLPACILVGALLMLICDIACQSPYTTQLLPINAVTALIGVPVIIWIILKRKT